MTSLGPMRLSSYLCNVRTPPGPMHAVVDQDRSGTTQASSSRKGCVYTPIRSHMSMMRFTLSIESLKELSCGICSLVK